MFNNFFSPEIRALYDNVEKCGATGGHKWQYGPYAVHAG